MEHLLSPEHRAFRDELRSFVEREIPKNVARAAEAAGPDYPLHLFDKLARAGYHATAVPTEYGGHGADMLTQLIQARELARSLAGMVWIWGMTSFAGANSIGLYGTEAQKREFLPRIARGDMRVTIGFTEPGGGTDVLGAMTTTAQKVSGGWVVNGVKKWCTSAHVSDRILLLARTDKDVQRKSDGVTLFLLDPKSEGVSLEALSPLGMRGLGTFLMELRDVFVPDDMVVGEPGRAWRMLLPTLTNERVLVLGTCTGILDGVLEDALAYVSTREAFGRRLGDLQAVQHHVANIAIAQYQTELIAYEAARRADAGEDTFMAVTMGKIIASEHAAAGADLGIQVMGGQGYSTETDMQRYWRDARLMRFSPVNNEMARNLVAERLGLARSF
ncbi:acyl-CoA dehydrogenase family protein [Nocardioides sp.]|uniref:acyl-CoA dehydrogenase family protein n=1 Tax=Nocardioides sp. TaxID=35761 RepID=UPI00260D52A8|nr:acyl-CoA dehydrogenase family protein [Nocardioides sp.]MDI6909223.1 acyl-CoA dehydrogenase family protein [Nocardioides sp.]